MCVCLVLSLPEQVVGLRNRILWELPTICRLTVVHCRSRKLVLMRSSESELSSIPTVVESMRQLQMGILESVVRDIRG